MASSNLSINDNNGVQLTNQELYIMTVRAAQNLQKLGFGSNDVFGYFARNHHNMSPIVFASLTIGAIVNPLDPHFKSAEVIHMFGKTKPRVIFCDYFNISILKEALTKLKSDVPIYSFGGHTNETRPVEELFHETGIEIFFVPPPLSDGEKHCAAIISSSGTTGAPKGVAIPHARYLANIVDLPPATNGVHFGFNTLHWPSGFLYLFSTTIKHYQRIYTTETFSTELFLKIIEKYKVTSVTAPPSSLSLTLKCPKLKQTDLSSLNFFVCSGSILHPQIVQEINDHLPNGQIINLYGISECGPVSSNHIFPRENSVGILQYKNMKVKILDKTGAKCGIGEDGELYIKVLHPFLGYWNDDEKTRNAFDDEGYFGTGDWGRFDEDGYLYIVERSKDILKYMNYQVAPSEIEGLISNHPDVKLVCVVGIPDLIVTDLPAAVIVRQEGNVTEDEIENLVKENLSDSKQLRGGVYFVDELPFTASGKMIKAKVKKIAIEKFHLKNK